MRVTKTIASVLVAGSLLAAPVAAQAAAAERTATDVQGENLRGGFIIPLVALIAIILGIIAATGGDDEELPHSP